MVEQVLALKKELYIITCGLFSHCHQGQDKALEFNPGFFGIFSHPGSLQKVKSGKSVLDINKINTCGWVDAWEPKLV